MLEKKPKNKTFIVNTLLLALFAAVIVGYSVASAVSGVLDLGVVSDGIYISGIDVSSMSLDEAKRALSSYEQSMLDNAKIELYFEGDVTLLDANALGVTTNKSAILDDLYNYNKTGNIALDFERSLELLKQTNLSIDYMIDFDKLRHTIEEFSDRMYIEPISSTTEFDKYSNTFFYTPSSNGREINQKSLFDLISDKLNSRDFSAVQIFGTIIKPDVSLEQLKEKTQKVASCETEVINNENRNTNIVLMCNAIDGLKIEPGQTLSLNELVGERTEAKGFKLAPAIIDGKMLENEIGGGICQLSGTLYNAALHANMEIVERVRHSWPSEYLPIGLDSTLNWDNKDLKIKNTSDWPLYISSELKNQMLNVTIYGAPLPDNVEIQIVNDVYETIKAPRTEIRYTYSLPRGVRRVEVVPRDGHNVRVYRNYYINGEQVKSELISEDKFPAIKGVTLEGSKRNDK